MKRHTKIYMDFFGFKGGNPKGDKDDIKNLMAMCRVHHNEYGDVPLAWLK